MYTIILKSILGLFIWLVLPILIFRKKSKKKASYKRFTTIVCTGFGILIENILFNSVKANAKSLWISVNTESEWVKVVFADDGDGLNKSISDANRIFEMGFSTTRGSGVGLAHAKRIMTEMEGSIMIDFSEHKGLKLIVRLKK